MALSDEPKPDPLMEALTNEREPVESCRLIDIGQYILNEKHEAVHCLDTLEWARWFETADRRVRLTRVGPYFISTVFLGLDHLFRRLGRPHEPLLFETMAWIAREHVSPLGFVFKRDWEDIQERCSTWGQALLQHQGIVDQLRADNPSDDVEEVTDD